MSIETLIFPTLGLMYTRFEGHITVPDAKQAFQAYLGHEDFAPGQKQFIDFTDVSSFSADYAELLQFIANMDAGTSKTQTTSLFVYLAPSALAREMSATAAKAWSASPDIAVRIADTEEAALEILGVPFTTVAALLSAYDESTSPVANV